MRLIEKFQMLPSYVYRIFCQAASEFVLAADKESFHLISTGYGH